MTRPPLTDDAIFVSSRHAIPLTTVQERVRDTLNDGLRSGRIARESVPCLCGTPACALEKLAESHRYGVEQPITICPNCGLIQLCPRMTEQEYERFYSSDAYRLLYDGEDFAERYERMLTPSQGQRILSAVLEHCARCASVLELGAGAGWNLVAFQAAGFQVKGWDYSEQLTRLGRSKGIPMSRGGIAEAITEGSRYDAIILNHVLEHLLEPVAVLSKLHGLLNPGGCLYIGVPATDFPSRGLLQSAHVYYFTDRTLSHYLARAGWIAGRIVHEDHFGMHTVARPGESQPLNLRMEYNDSLTRLRANRQKMAFLAEWYRVRSVLLLCLTSLGLCNAVRAAYRRLSS